MNINDIFSLEQYDEAYAFISKNESTTIQDLGDGKYQIIKLSEPSLIELKNLKRAEINAARDAAEQGGFLYKGKIFDSDSVSCIRISSAAQAMALAPEGTTITWTCQDNTTIDLTSADLDGLVVALAEWSNICHRKATGIKKLLDECQTPEEIEKISWDMPLDVEEPKSINSADINSILTK